MQNKALSTMHGAALIEWVLIFPLALFMILGIVEIGFWLAARSAVNYASFEAAREGAMSHANLSVIDISFKKALVPFYGGGTSADEMVKTYSDKVLPDLAESFSTVEIVSPTPASINDFGVIEAGKLQIPNDNLTRRSAAIGFQSGQSIQDANLLKIKIVYGYQLKTPLVRMIVIDFLKIITTDEQALLMYGNNRIPIIAQAMVRMQSSFYHQPAWKTPYGLM